MVLISSPILQRFRRWEFIPLVSRFPDCWLFTQLFWDMIYPTFFILSCFFHDLLVRIDTSVPVAGRQIWSLLLMEEILHQLTCSLSVYPHYLQSFSTIPGGWEWDFWTINSINSMPHQLIRCFSLIHPDRFVDTPFKVRLEGMDPGCWLEAGLPWMRWRCLLMILLEKLSFKRFTPWKMIMKPENYLFEQRNYLNQTFICGLYIHFQGCICVCYLWCLGFSPFLNGTWTKREIASNHL